MKKLMKVLFVLPLMAVLVLSSAYAEDTDTVDVMVQPQVNVDLSIPEEDDYNFGTLELNTSSRSATAVRLNNEGDVGVTLQSHVEGISSDEGEYAWGVASSTGADQFSLYHAVNEGMMELEDYVDAHKLGETADTLFLQDGSTQAEIGSGEEKESWFRIDMPDAVEYTAEHTITVEVTATSK